MLKKAPLRSCVMCREKKDKRELLRIVRTPEGTVAFDPTGKANGRGAYVCFNSSCLSNVKNIKKISAALALEADRDNLDKVFEEIKSYAENKHKGE